MKNAFLFGCLAGLLTTMFDGLYMLIPDLFISSPYYPIMLLTFNILLWVVVSCTAAAIAILIAQKRHDTTYLVLIVCFGVFIVVYGILGKFSLSQLPQSFDNHLSFLWSSFIFLFLLFSEVRKKSLYSLKPASLLVDLTVIIILYNVCTNIDKSLFLSNLHENILWKVIQNYKVFLISVYLLFICTVLGLYILYAIKGKRLHHHDYRALCIITIMVGISLFACLLINRTMLSGNTTISQSSPFPDKQKKISSVILIILDTVRADRLSVLIKNGVAKSLERFSREAVVFEKCFAPSPWTFPSHASLFTGFYTSEHQADYDIRNGIPLNLPIPLAESFLTLAEIFSQNHYATAAVVSNRSLFLPELNMHQGFQIKDISAGIGKIYFGYPFHPILHVFCDITNLLPKYTLFYRTAEDMNKSIFSTLDKLANMPFFLFVNYMDAHEPYTPPPPYNGLYLNTNMPHVYRIKQQFRHMINRCGKKSWDSFLLSQYDGEIAYLDRQVGELFAELDRRGLYDSSLIIVTSDHGEMLGEHGLYSHKTPLYEEVLRVPLMIKFPYNHQNSSNNSLITLVDLFPTILKLCDLPIPDNISGKVFGGNAETAVAEFFHHTTGLHRALREGSYKYMRYSIAKKPELYDLVRDPREQHNLVDTLPEVAATMERKMRQWEKEHIKKTEIRGVATRDILEELKTLGYIQ